MKLLFIVITYFSFCTAYAQQYSEADTLRGMLTPFRTAYDVTDYHLNVQVFPEEKSIKGSTEIFFTALADFDTLQVDLFENMVVDSILFEGKKLKHSRLHNAVFIYFSKKQRRNSTGSFTVYYRGQPREAVRPPWDGGFVWTKTKSGKPWIATAVQGVGASLWWPNKDHPSDEPDSMTITCTVPNGLMCIANGDLAEKRLGKDRSTYVWKVSYPINNYNVTLNITDFAHFSDNYISKGDTLRLDYYVLPDNLAKAKKHFRQVHKMLGCFEQYLGPYPFPEDGYALVETPYWGMEHQGAIAYGNNYKNNELGFDYIIVHETAHEWWGNSVSTADNAELWIHESFGTYTEALYVECLYGYKAAIKYINDKKDFVRNKHPIIGTLNVNHRHEDSDMYYKGSLMLNTLRHVINDNSLWFEIIYGLANDFKHRIINTDSVINYMESKTGKELDYFFDQYLKKAELPVFQYQIKEKGQNMELKYRWKADAENFRMPVKVTLHQDQYELIYPTTEWQTTTLQNINKKDFKVAEDFFYIEVEGK